MNKILLQDNMHTLKPGKKIENLKNSQYFVKAYPNEYPNNEPQHRCPDISKIKREFNYSPKYTFNKGLLSCYTFFVRKN